MQSYSNNQSIEEESFRSLKLQPHVQSVPQQPQYSRSLASNQHPVKHPQSRISISQNSQSESASIQQPQLQSLANLPSQQQQPKRKSQHQSNPKKSEISNFIIKTYRILEDPINSNIIQWTDQGNAFIVKNKDKFQNQILPKYFKHKKFSSFVRQLNMYDFHKIRKQKEIPIFKHKYFKQGCVDLLCKIKRKSGDEGGTMGGFGEDEDQGQGMDLGTKNYIPSMLQLGQRPMISAYSFKSKSHLPYPSILTSQPSIGMLPGSGNHVSEIDLLIQQNSELTQSISQLTRQQSGLELQRERKREKILKILSVLVNFDLDGGRQEEVELLRGSEDFLCSESADIASIRELQNHFSCEEEPFNLLDYGYVLRNIYNKVKNNLMQMNQNINSESQEHKIQQQQIQQAQQQVSRQF